MASKRDYDKSVRQRYMEQHAVDGVYDFWMGKRGQPSDLDTRENQINRWNSADYHVNRDIEMQAEEEARKAARAKAKALRRSSAVSGGGGR